MCGLHEIEYYFSNVLGCKADSVASDFFDIPQPMQSIYHAVLFPAVEIQPRAVS